MSDTTTTTPDPVTVRAYALALRSGFEYLTALALVQAGYAGAL